MAFINDTKPVASIEFIVTEALDFLMTEDNDYLVTDESTSYSNETKVSNNYTNDSK